MYIGMLQMTEGFKVLLANSLLGKIKTVLYEDVNWINLAQDKERYRNIVFHKNHETFDKSGDLSNFCSRICLWSKHRFSTI